MSLLLRQVRREYWYQGQEHDWLPVDEAPNSCLYNLCDKKSRPSFWLIDQDKNNLWQVVAALVLRQKQADSFEYAIIEEARVCELQITVDDSRRDHTPDRSVDALHRELLNLTAQKTAKLADAIRKFGEFGSLFEKEVLEYALERIGTGVIDKSRIGPEARSRIKKLLGTDITT